MVDMFFLLIFSCSFSMGRCASIWMLTVDSIDMVLMCRCCCEVFITDPIHAPVPGLEKHSMPSHVLLHKMLWFCSIHQGHRLADDVCWLDDALIHPPRFHHRVP